MSNRAKRSITRSMIRSLSIVYVEQDRIIITWEVLIDVAKIEVSEKRIIDH